MTSFRQIEANRRNALRSTGPKTQEGKWQSRRNALRHGLTAETVIDGLEDSEDYRAFEAAVIADYDARTAVERELVLRLASLLWRLRLGVVTEDLNRTWYERNTGHAITAVQTRVKHPALTFLAATLDGMVTETGAVYEAKFMLPWLFSDGAAAEKYMAQLRHVGDQRQDGGTLDHHRGWQMGGDLSSRRSPLPAPPAHRGEEVLALCPVRGPAAPVWCGAPQAADRGGEGG
jgi:hypothetical protein